MPNPAGLGTAQWSEFGVKPEQAIAALRAKLNMTPEQFRALDEKYKAQGFYVAGLENEQIIGAVKDSLVRALDEGQTFAQWLASVADTLGEFEKAHLETVFKTNLFSAYSAGRYQAAMDPQVRQSLPWWEYRVALDKDCPICGPLDGFQAPKDDPIWEGIFPPNHFNCACACFSIPAPEGEEADELDADYPGPGTGFDHPPTMSAEEDQDAE